VKVERARSHSAAGHRRTRTGTSPRTPNFGRSPDTVDPRGRRGSKRARSAGVAASPIIPTTLEPDLGRPSQLRPQFLDLRLRGVELLGVDIQAAPGLAGATRSACAQRCARSAFRGSSASRCRADGTLRDWRTWASWSTKGPLAPQSPPHSQSRREAAPYSATPMSLASRSGSAPSRADSPS